MGRGAKIFFASALVASVVFGLIAFVIVSAIIDKDKKSDDDAGGTEAAYHEFYNDNILEER